MRYIDEFRNRKLIRRFADKIKTITPSKEIKIMEVCGTHTNNFYRFGLDRLLPENLKFIAGPGCPVCVSSQGYIDSAIKLAEYKDVIITTFGDMLRVPGTYSTLEKERVRFGNVQVVYSPLDSLNVAKRNPTKKIVFLAVGFETTAPTIVLSIILASREKLKNLYFFSSVKTMPQTMESLVKDQKININGFICPGHVSAIIGAGAYEFIAKRYALSCCVAGFEPLDIMEGIYLLLQQIIKHKPEVINQYTRVVKKQGNLRAQKIIKQVFKTSDAYWRGLGNIPNSGLKIRDRFSDFDAERVFSLKPTDEGLKKQKTPCRCGDVLKGLILPKECSLFSKVCSPGNPIGPCMVASEGACNAYYKYKSSR